MYENAPTRSVLAAYVVSQRTLQLEDISRILLDLSMPALLFAIK